MIIYRTEPYRIQMRNIMLLDDIESKGVVYVNKDTYDQALLLSGRLDGDPQRVLNIIKTPKNQIYLTIAGLKGLMENMIKTMPKPLNMLAPFLILCATNQGIEWKADDRVFAYGILHQFSQLTDFNSITTVSAEVRSNVSLPTALLMQYQASWDELCSSLTDKVVLGEPTEDEISANAGLSLETKFAELESKMLKSVTSAIESAVARIPVTIQQVPNSQQGAIWSNGAVISQPAQMVQPTQQAQPVQPAQTAQPVQPTAPAPTPVAPAAVQQQPAAQAQQNSAPKSEDEQKADDILAIIEAMKNDSKKRDEDRKKKMGEAKPATPKPEAAPAQKTTDDGKTVIPLQTGARSTAQESKEINQVFDEFDF